MTDMRKRAAKAAQQAWLDLPDCPGEMYFPEAQRITDAALLAALDPEDDETVSWIACELSTDEDIVYQVIASLRDRVAKGESDD